MSFEIFVASFVDAKPSRLPRNAVRHSFGAWLIDESPTVWHIKYGPADFCDIFVDDHPETVANFMVSRPVSDGRLWDALFRVMNLGNVVLYWTNRSPPLVASLSVIRHLPREMVNSLGTPICVHAGAEILDRIKSS